MTEYDITKGFAYMYFEGKPGYPFGHGLSDTNFTYANQNIAPVKMNGSGQVTVRFNVRNAGKVAGPTRWCSSTCMTSRQASRGPRPSGEALNACV